jgi:L-lactate dehydrogenase complex protein LldE
MRVGLFVPCYINAFFPEIGATAFELVEHLEGRAVRPHDWTEKTQEVRNAPEL